MTWRHGVYRQAIRIVVRGAKRLSMAATIDGKLVDASRQRVTVAISSVGAIGILMDGKPFKPAGFLGATRFFAACAWLPCRDVRLFLCQLKVL